MRLQQNQKGITNTFVQSVVVEGEIDYMSVFECGATCIGLGSTSNIKKIFNYDTSQTTLIIALDNDNAGLKATTELEKLCKQYKTAYINALTTIWNGYKDANELLITNKGTLIENLNEQISKALSFNRDKYLHQIEKEEKDNTHWKDKLNFYVSFLVQRIRFGFYY